MSVRMESPFVPMQAGRALRVAGRLVTVLRDNLERVTYRVIESILEAAILYRGSN